MSAEISDSPNPAPQPPAPPDRTPGSWPRSRLGAQSRSWLDRLLRRGQPDIPVLRLVGTIGQAGFGRSGMTLASLESHIARAFATKGPVVALVVNSPGGSPVQSSLIAGRIRDLAVEKNKTVIAFVEDVAASGGYWLACAADEIIADKSSIVGSIGVISAGFGFTGLLERMGVERRVYTAGTRKLILDPFSPERQDDVHKLESLQQDVHEAFIKLVRERRGDRLAAGDGTTGSDIFNGEFWSGEAARRLGLVDAIDHMRPFLRARYGSKLRLRVVNPDKPSLRRRFGLAGGVSGGVAGGLTTEDARSLVHAVLDVMDERAQNQRYDLS
ncbi:S49 family peptidase [Fodinicurvata sp. EGI_FJ10296]|uniref:S49 family peptidase n=1 Tax=Fodinicurvata sp. EGI_FJ10296 TaxID=3231908 RepID=UPI003455FF17